MSYIELKDVSFAYPGGFLAVDHLTLNIEKGENVAMLFVVRSGNVNFMDVFSHGITCFECKCGSLC